MIGLRPRTSSVLAEHELDVCPDWVAVKKKRARVFPHMTALSPKKPFSICVGVKITLTSSIRLQCSNPLTL